MRDFFVHINQSKESQYVNEALAYFEDMFPDVDNYIKFYDGLIVTFSNDSSEERMPSPFWCKARGAYLFVFGEYFLPDDLKIPKFPAINDSRDIINLFEVHGDALFEKIPGNFNALIYYPKSQRFFSVNSKLGLYPVYYYQDGADFLVSSRLGVFKKILGEGQADLSVVMQHCLYNYPVSSKTFIKDAFVQPAGSVLSFINGEIRVKNYWTIDDYSHFSGRTDFSQSIELLDEVLDRLIRKHCSKLKKIGLSLTGGWDGRLLLAYALKYLSPDQLLLYSHGTLESPDVILPLATSKKFDLSYIPVLLNEPVYLNQQLQWAADTVKYSDGIRQVTRLHYLYNMSILRNDYGISTIMSGNGGSNLLKCTNYKPCPVFNRFVIELIESDNYEGILRKHYDYCFTNFSSLFQDVDWKSFLDSFDQDSFQSLFSIRNKDWRFLHFLVSETERKYFGPEIQSYKHLVKNYSPFFDDEFIKALSQTIFVKPNANKGLIKSHYISLFYAKLISKNNKLIAKEPTDRGFTMNEVANPVLFPKMIYKYLKNKITRNNIPDYFNNKRIAKSYATRYFPQLNLDSYKSTLNNSFIENYISAMSFLTK